MGSSASWPLTSTSTSTGATPSSGSSGYTGVPQRLLGRALVRPLRRDGISDFASASGLARIQAALGQILGTRSSSAREQGEVPWRPDFGSRLHLIQHRNLTPVTEEIARQYILEAVEKWLPMVRIQSVVASKEGEVLVLAVSYAVVSKGTGQQVGDGVVRVPLQAANG